MQSLFCMLKKIRYNYLLYLGEVNIKYLRAFIDGYLTCEEENGKSNVFDQFNAFEKYIANIYNCQESYDFSSILLKRYKDDKTAIEKFFEHLEVYMREQYKLENN